MSADQTNTPQRNIGRRTLAVAQGDITLVAADAIVNAANSGLRGGGGVDGAIHRAGGPEIMSELRARYDRCDTGDAVITGAGRLPARWVVHAVGPIWSGGSRREPELLESAYLRALARAAEAGARTVALPAISCGIYGFPVDRAAPIALRAVARHLSGPTTIELATFVLYSRDTYEAFRQALSALDLPEPADSAAAADTAGA